MKPLDAAMGQLLSYQAHQRPEPVPVGDERIDARLERPCRHRSDSGTRHVVR